MPAATLADLAPATRRALLAGVERFNAGQFFEAHEAWEEAWLVEEAALKTFLQALIQLAAAYHKGLVMRSPRGMASLFGQAREKFEDLLTLGPRLGGLDLRTLHDAAKRGEAQAAAWAGGERPAFPGDARILLEAGQ
jgi:predicted metal-dependent hydrolase